MRRMLIVEDEEGICDCLEQFFSGRGFSVVSAFSGEEAVERLRASPADVILIDIMLPGISGIEVLKRVKELRPEARVVMVTARDEAEVREAARQYGADAYITKPFNFSDATWSPVFANPT